MKKLLSILAVTALLSGCGTTKLIDTARADSPIQKGQARIIISRDDSTMYFASSAVVNVNSQEVADLGRGGTVVHDVSSGKVSIDVHAYSSFAYYAINVNAQAGKTYRFMISPRGSQMLYSPLSYVGDYVSSVHDDKTGYFKIVPVQ